MAILICIAVVFAFAIGVAESTRIIKELHVISGELHARLADLEAEIKNIKFPLS